MGRASAVFAGCAGHISEVLLGLAGTTRHWKQLNLPQKHRRPALGAAKVSQVEEERLYKRQGELSKQENGRRGIAPALSEQDVLTACPAAGQVCASRSSKG